MTGYIVQIFIPCHPDRPDSIKDALKVHEMLANDYDGDDMGCIVSAPAWQGRRRKSPAPQASPERMPVLPSSREVPAPAVSPETVGAGDHEEQAEWVRASYERGDDAPENQPQVGHGGEFEDIPERMRRA